MPRMRPSLRKADFDQFRMRPAMARDRCSFWPSRSDIPCAEGSGPQYSLRRFSATSSDAQGHNAIDIFLHFVNQSDDLFGAIHRHFDLDLIADSTFSLRMSGLRTPVATSLISKVIGFFFSKGTFAFANATLVIF